MTPFSIDHPLKAFDITKDEDIWIFAYGSLMWNPEFDYEEAHIAQACGYHRRFCLKCDYYRGSPENQGLVLGLDRGGSCRGIAYKVSEKNMRKTLETLWKREMRAPDAYVAKKIPVALSGTTKERVMACVFVSNPNSTYYFSERCPSKTAARIASAKGVRGSNLEYLERTVYQLQKNSIKDTALEKLYAHVQSGKYLT